MLSRQNQGNCARQVSFSDLMTLKSVITAYNCFNYIMLETIVFAYRQLNMVNYRGLIKQPVWDPSSPQTSNLVQNLLGALKA